MDGTSVVREEVLPNGSKFAYGHDIDDTVTAISQSTEEGEENSTQKVYRYGELVELKSGNNNVKYSYDYKRKLKSVDLNSETDYVQYSYVETTDSYGAVAKETVTATYKSGDVFVSEKDGNGNLLKLKANGVVQVENVYDKKGQLDALKDKVTDKNYKFERDELDNITAVYEVDANDEFIQNGYVEDFKYDAFGNLQRKTITGPVSCNYIYTYDGQIKDRLKGLTTPIATETYEYDCLGRKKKIMQSFGGKHGKRFTYRKVGDHTTNQIQSIAYLKDGITDGKLSYTYDNMGNITSVSENGRQTVKYTYDALNRLIKENLLDKDKEICYTYDNNGNILTKSVNGEVVEYRYKEDSDQLMSFGNETFAYDVMGNPTTYRGMTAVWKKGKQLKFLNASVNNVGYTHDGKGLRRTKHVGGITTTYTYDSNGKLLKEEGAKTIEYVYGAEGIIGIIIDQIPYLFRKNVFGDVTHIYNVNGGLVGKYSYTAFGECMVDLDINGVASDNPIRYRSYYYDTDWFPYLRGTTESD